MVLRCGIVGLPNVGKSSLFNALTEASAAAENFPFCTIEPNVGVVPLADARLKRLAELAGSAKTVPAAVRLVDIAGLVRGSSQGEGLGNRFLAHIREVDGIVHVLRCFADSGVAHVGGRVDPLADAQAVEIELMLADIETVRKNSSRQERLARSGDKRAKARLELERRVACRLDEGVPVRNMELAQEEMDTLAELCLITAKPVLFCANLGEEERPETSAAFRSVAELAEQQGAAAVPVSAKYEAELAGLPAEDRLGLLAGLGMEETGMTRLARAAYALLQLHTFFTAGPAETRAWELPEGATAQQAAGRIHTDMQRGFIRAEIIAYADYLELGGETACRNSGKMRLEGREYVICDGDVAHFRFNA